MDAGIVQGLKSVFGQRGLLLEKADEDLLVFRHKVAPLRVEVVLGEAEATIRLIGENIEEFLEDLAEEEEDIRSFIEEVLDDISAAINDASIYLTRLGKRVRTLNVRDVVLDILDAVDEIEQSRA